MMSSRTGSAVQGDLHPPWEEKTTSDGRTFYLNHMDQRTSWTHPSATEADEASAPTAPPTYSAHIRNHPDKVETGNAVAPNMNASGSPSNAPTIRTSSRGFRGQLSTADRAKRPHTLPWLGFCVPVVFSWIVWAFAVAASVDDGWTDDGSDMGIGSEGVCDGGNYENEAACSEYQIFEIMQTVAVAVCSLAVLFLTLPFIPMNSTGGATTWGMGLCGGILMVIYAILQLAAFLSFDNVIVEANYAFGRNTFTVGPTYIVAVVAFALAVLDCILIFSLFRRAGDSPNVKRGFDGMATQDETTGGARAREHHPVQTGCAGNPGPTSLQQQRQTGGGGHPPAFGV